MVDQQQVQAVLISGPMDGDVGDHHDGVQGLRFASVVPHREHYYGLESIVGGVARYEYFGLVRTKTAAPC